MLYTKSQYRDILAEELQSLEEQILQHPDAADNLERTRQKHIGKMYEFQDQFQENFTFVRFGKPLRLIIVEDDDGVEGVWSYGKKLFKRLHEVEAWIREDRRKN